MSDQGPDAAHGPRPMVRARHGAVEVPGLAPPWDRLQYRIFHPALLTGAANELQTGALPADRSLAPWPVVLLLNGINVGPESYRWLAEVLATHGFATVTFGHVSEVTPGEVGLSPGLDLSAVHVDAWGTRPSATTVGPLLDALAAENADGPLAGLLDLDRVALAGHSAGGTVALMNARTEWFPGVRACVSYAGHSMPATMFGHPEGTVLPPDPTVPALVMGGTCDDVVAVSAQRYRPGSGPLDRADGHDPISATFEASGAGSVLAVLDGARHLTVCDPVDPTTARGFLEPDGDPRGPARRDLVASLVVRFCLDHLAAPGHVDRAGGQGPAGGHGPVDGNGAPPPPMEELGRNEALAVFRMM